MASAVLLDADGVVQQNPVGWLDELRAVVAPEHADDFVGDLFHAEQPALRGERDFAAVVREVAQRWGLDGRVEELMAHWRRVHVSRETLGLVRELRAAGTSCWLASNQNSYRARYMRESLGYDAVFDGQFYSCDLGITKDSPAFFERAVAVVGLAPADIVHVDDKDKYLDAARAAGLSAQRWSIEEGIDVLRAALAGYRLLA